MNKEDKHDLNLPDKLWECGMIALEDLDKTEKDPRFRIDMNIYFSGLDQKDRKCGCCFAGSIMAQCSSIDIRYRTWSGQFKDCEKLEALNQMRLYHFNSMMSLFFCERRCPNRRANAAVKELRKTFPYEGYCPEYDYNKEDFKRNIEVVCYILRKHDI